MSDLAIPEAAIDAVALAIDPDEPIDSLHEDDRDEIRAALTAAAPRLIAAELRRLADEATRELDGWVRAALRRSIGAPDSPAYRDMDKQDTKLRYHRDRLLARADELDGGTQ